MAPHRGEHHSSNRIFLKGLKFPPWAYGNNVKSWSGGKSVTAVSWDGHQHKSRVSKFPCPFSPRCIP